MRVKLGAGLHQVQRASVLPDSLGGEIKDLNRDNYSSLYVKSDFLHNDPALRFGGSVQLYDQVLFSTAWFEFIPQTLKVEFKYAKTILRPVRDWENDDFIMISPRFYFSF